jgi:hypothetical protein
MKHSTVICFISILLFLLAGNLTVYASTEELNRPLEKQEVINICKVLLDGYSTFMIEKNYCERLAAEAWYKHVFKPADDLLNTLFPKYARKLEYRFIKDN